MTEYNSLREVHRRRKNRAAAPIGALVLILAAAGLVALIILGVNLTSQILDNSREKQKFEKIIQPVLMFDPPPFEDVTTLDKFTVLQAALWATMLGDKRETYPFDAQGNLIVPSSDVDVTSTQLFGPELELEHQSFSDFGISYEYNEATKAYHVPVMSASALYTPRVDEITRDGDTYSLLVGYIPPGTAWNTDIAGNKTEPDPHKFMIYELKRLDKHYQLTAIKDPPPEKQVGYGTEASVPDGAIASVGEDETLPDGEGGVYGEGEEGALASSSQEDGSSSAGESSSDEPEDDGFEEDSSTESSSEDSSEE
ncbi:MULTISPECIES: hypothetical protein [Oscillospiraceae]|uniref:hypothetical protein n=1 Tax=Oscillospiraceae TaxID=216572 RepID=UPI0009A6CD3B|nr:MULTISPECIES: hypothetical protein [Oscillospiraceae]RGB66994.1 hypothetical protein DW086_07470 [Harryflintia acetispora]